jgi:hypothetical protein
LGRQVFDGALSFMSKLIPPKTAKNRRNSYKRLADNWLRTFYGSSLISVEGGFDVNTLLTTGCACVVLKKAEIFTIFNPGQNVPERNSPDGAEKNFGIFGRESFHNFSL